MKRDVVRTILLDMGKVLVDFDFKLFSDRLCRFVEIDPELLRGALTGNSLQHTYELGQLNDDEFHNEICRRLGKEVTREEFVAAWTGVFLPIPLLSEDLIRRLAARAQLWIVSNTNKLHFDYLRARFPFFGLFKGFVLSHEVGAMKPDPWIFREALARAGSKASEALFVDDQIVNVEAARELGIEAFQFLSPDQFTSELQRRELL